MNIRNLSLFTAPFLALIPLLTPGVAGSVQSLSDQEESTSDESKALDIARAYLAGISGGNELDKLDGLFVPGDRSSVYENGSDEGDWLHYKEHHLAPEQEHVENFRFTTNKEGVERLGEGFLVRHVGGFTLDLEDETRSYRAAVSFVLVPVEDDLRILHLHWSSRQRP